MKFIRIAQTTGKYLSSTQGESGNSTASGFRTDLVILLNERDHLVEDLFCEKIRSHHIHSGGQSTPHHLGIRVGIRHYYDHFLCQPLGNEIIQNHIDPSYLEPGFIRICHSVDQVQNGILLFAFGIVSRRGIDAHGSVKTHVFRMIVSVRYFSVRHILHILKVRDRSAYIHQTVLEILVGKNVYIIRICYLNPVYHEAIRINIRNRRGYRYAPNPFFILCHSLVSLKHLAV